MNLSQDTAELAERWPLVRAFALPPGSRALVAGAYKGLVVRLLREMYDCFVLGCEPQYWAYEIAVAASLNDRNVVILPLALGVQSAELPMGEWGTDACSFVRIGEQWRKHDKGIMIDAAKMLEPYYDKPLDLFVCNMEGYEFELLPYLAMAGYIGRTHRLALQFHFDLVENDRERHRMIREGLSVTHDLVSEPPGWEYWTIKPSFV